MNSDYSQSLRTRNKKKWRPVYGGSISRSIVYGFGQSSEREDIYGRVTKIATCHEDPSKVWVKVIWADFPNQEVELKRPILKSKLH